MADKPQVLYVDDDAELRTLYSYILRSRGFDVYTCENGECAKALLRSREIDFILLDLMMPGIDGLTLLRWLRQEEKSGVPVLMLSAVTKPGVKETLLEAGANDVLVKPVGVPELLNQIEVLFQAGSQR